MVQWLKINLTNIINFFINIIDQVKLFALLVYVGLRINYEINVQRFF